MNLEEGVYEWFTHWTRGQNVRERRLQRAVTGWVSEILDLNHLIA